MKKSQREEAIRSELRAIRRLGLTPAALADCPETLMSPRISTAVELAPAGSVPEEVARATISGWIESLPRPRRIEALAAAYNMGGSDRNLTVRRAQIAEQHQMSVASMKVDEWKAIDELVEWLLSDPESVPASQGPLEYEFKCWLAQLNITARLGKEFHSVYESRVVEAKFDGADDFLIFVDYPGVPGAVVVEAVDNCVIERREVADKSYFIHVAKLDRALMKGERSRFTLRRQVPSSGGEFDRLVITPRVPVRRFRLAINFGGVQPEVARRVEHLPKKVLEGGLPAGPVANVSRFAYAEETFIDLEPNWAYGLAWRWPPTGEA